MRKVGIILIYICTIVSMHIFLLPHGSFAADSGKEAYLLYPNDIVEISVYQESDLTKSCTVSQDGTINYPLLGTIYVKGVSAKELEGKITRLLAEDYLVEPYVSVVVREYANYSILGQIGKPGSYDLSPGLTLSQAIVRAGGFNENSKKESVKLMRIQQGEKFTTIYDVDQILKSGNKEMDPLLLPEDTITVDAVLEKTAEKQFVYALGQVKRPGKYEYTEGASVFTLVSEAGGLTDIAAANKTKIIRSEYGKSTTIQVSLGSILAGDTSKDIQLQPGDTVMVPESFF